MDHGPPRWPALIEEGATEEEASREVVGVTEEEDMAATAGEEGGTEVVEGVIEEVGATEEEEVEATEGEEVEATEEMEATAGEEGEATAGGVMEGETEVMEAAGVTGGVAEVIEEGINFQKNCSVFVMQLDVLINVCQVEGRSADLFKFMIKLSNKRFFLNTAPV